MLFRFAASRSRFYQHIRFAGVLLAWWAPICVSATTVIPPEFSALVGNSDCIVRAVVKAVHAEKKSGARGPKIITHVEIEVLEAVAGSPPAALTLDFLGGRVGDEEMTVEGMPHFEVGDEDVLFVQGNGRSICPLYAMMYGRYPIVKDSSSGRKHVARVGGEALRDTAQIATPVTESSQPLSSGSRTTASVAALTPEEFIAQIKAHLDGNRGRPAAK